MTPEERAAYIGAQIAGRTLTFSRGGINFRVTNGTVSGPAVRVEVTAWTGAGGNRVDLPVGDGVFVFVNPPLMVPDGGTETITDPHGEQITRPSFVRDDINAAKQIVYDAVTTCARSLGWTP